MCSRIIPDGAEKFTLADSEPARSMRLRKERVRATWTLGSASGPGLSLLSMLSLMMVWLLLLPSLNAVAETCGKAFKDEWVKSGV